MPKKLIWKKQKSKVVWKYPIWDGKKYRIGVDKEGNLSGEVQNLCKAMKPTMQHIMLKHNHKVPQIDHDDIQQLLWYATFHLLRLWKPKKSLWGTYHQNYCWKYTIYSLLRKQEQPTYSDVDFDTLQWKKMSDDDLKEE